MKGGNLPGIPSFSHSFIDVVTWQKIPPWTPTSSYLLPGKVRPSNMGIPLACCFEERNSSQPAASVSLVPQLRQSPRIHLDRGGRHPSVSYVFSVHACLCGQVSLREEFPLDTLFRPVLRSTRFQQESHKRPLAFSPVSACPRASPLAGAAVSASAQCSASLVNLFESARRR